jgi:hypothetical protein
MLLTTTHRSHFFDISAKNMRTSGVAFGKKAGKLDILTNVKCCSCLFYYQLIVIKCTIIILTTRKFHEVRFVIK